MLYRLQRTLPVWLDGVTAEVCVAEFRDERGPGKLLLSNPPTHVNGPGHPILTVTTTTRWTSTGFSNPLVHKLDSFGFIGMRSPMPYAYVDFAEGRVQATIGRTGMGEPRLAAEMETLRMDLVLFTTAGDDFTWDEQDWEIDTSRGPDLLVVRPRPQITATPDPTPR